MEPRAVIVHRMTELAGLLGDHGTRGKAAFFLKSRDRDLGEVEHRHGLQQRAMNEVSKAVPSRWRRATVERSDLDRFLFEPGDIIVAVGQDGLVANTSKYLDGQAVIGINPDLREEQKQQQIAAKEAEFLDLICLTSAPMGQIMGIT